MKAFAALGRFDETQPFAPWLKRIAINAAVDSLRRSRRLEVVQDEESTFHTWALGESAEDDLRRWAVADAAALGAAKRIVVVLHYWLDLPLEEIAGVLGLPIGTVASGSPARRTRLAPSWRKSVSSDFERVLREAREALRTR